jgi:hypothetical protein
MKRLIDLKGRSIDSICEQGVASIDISDSFPNYSVEEYLVESIRSLVWRYYFQGILIPTAEKELMPSDGQRFRMNFYFSMNSFLVTPYGVSELTDPDKEIKVYDPEGYLDNFPGADEEMRVYLQESIAVFQDNHLTAAVILLGMASERLVDVMIEKIKESLGEPASKKWYADKLKNKKNISEKFEEMKIKLTNDFSAQLDAASAKEGMRTILSLVFDEIRIARNEAAHLKGVKLTKSRVRGLLRNFVEYYIYAKKIIDVLETVKAPQRVEG